MHVYGMWHMAYGWRMLGAIQVTGNLFEPRWASLTATGGDTVRIIVATLEDYTKDLHSWIESEAFFAKVQCPTEP